MYSNSEEVNCQTMTDIAMLTNNRARITRIAITELVRRTTTAHNLIVLDNGSTDGTADLLHELAHEDMVHIGCWSDENNGVHWGHNELLDEVKSQPYYISTDNDIIPQSPVDGVDWLAKLIALADAHPEYAAIACRSHAFIGDSQKMFEGAGEIVERGHVGAHLRIMRTEAVRETGGWKREKRPSRNNEERWICGRLRKAGWKIGFARDIRCIHLWGNPDLGEDEWGYTAGTYHEGHNPVWPPPSRFNWDRQNIDWETCK